MTPSILPESPAGDPTVPRLELAEWAERYGLTAGITTREHGFSLGLWTDEPSGQVMGRWQAFRSAFRDRFPTVVLAHQVHGTDVRWHEEVGAGWLLLDGADGHATDQAGVLLTVTVADCVPIYLAAPRQGVVALLHAGWRGVAGGILERGVRLLGARSILPQEIVMHCGASICGRCYEVGSEVASQLGCAPAAGPVQIDLRTLLAERAGRLGVGTLTISSFCSAHDSTLFFSHRASRGRAGRMVAYLGRPTAAGGAAVP